MKKDPTAALLGVLPLWGTMGLALLGMTQLQSHLSPALVSVAQADQASIMGTSMNNPLHNARLVEVDDTSALPTASATVSETAPAAPLSDDEAERKLHDMFDTSAADTGPRPGQPELARLGVSEAHIEAVWFDAAREGKTELLTGLVKRGFDPNLQNEKGYTALILATYHGHVPTVEALVAAGAKPCGPDSKGNTALMGAAFKGEPDLVRYLASRGCSVNTQNAAGQTALMMASLFGRDETVKTLLALGADPALVDKSGATAFSLAKTQGESGLMKLLQQTLDHSKKP